MGLQPVQALLSGGKMSTVVGRKKLKCGIVFRKKRLDEIGARLEYSS
jgi:hypothetical protein